MLTENEQKQTAMSLLSSRRSKLFKDLNVATFYYLDMEVLDSLISNYAKELANLSKEVYVCQHILDELQFAKKNYMGHGIMSSLVDDDDIKIKHIRYNQDGTIKSVEK